ncbi:MAG: hypothetical protein LBH76_08035, partial [Propionibacteriaceae bacterium]|nr:hypothetical protein [Propionibacteriaceae bacterium]
AEDAAGGPRLGAGGPAAAEPAERRQPASPAAVTAGESVAPASDGGAGSAAAGGADTVAGDAAAGDGPATAGDVAASGPMSGPGPAAEAVGPADGLPDSPAGKSEAPSRSPGPGIGSGPDPGDDPDGGVRPDDPIVPLEAVGQVAEDLVVELFGAELVKSEEGLPRPRPPGS